MDNDLNGITFSNTPPRVSQVTAFFSMFSALIFGIFILVLVYLGGKWAISSFIFNPVMVKLADGQIFFGDLRGKSLCSYIILNSQEDPKTHKSSIHASKGGSVYGGTGCLDLQEPISFTEKLTPGSQLYQAIQNPNMPLMGSSAPQK